VYEGYRIGQIPHLLSNFTQPELGSIKGKSNETLKKPVI
jgi:hypothetical protein